MIGKARPARWNGLIVLLHWTVAAIILAHIALGWAMIYGGLDAATTFDLFQWLGRAAGRARRSSWRRTIDQDGGVLPA